MKTYCGPDYKVSLTLNGKAIFPKKFNDKQIENFTRINPECASWWTDAPAEPEKVVESAKIAKEK